MQLTKVFKAAAQRCAEGANEWHELVRPLGAAPEKRSSVAGTLHRAWVDIKAASVERMCRRTPMDDPNSGAALSQDHAAWWSAAPLNSLRYRLRKSRTLR